MRAKDGRPGLVPVPLTAGELFARLRPAYGAHSLCRVLSCGSMHARNLAPAQTLPWRAWYSLQRWRTRAKHQLRTDPLCCLCKEQGRVTPATIADHNPPHRGDYNAFLLGPLRSLCKPCHDGLQAIKHKGYQSDVGDDGYPIDARHPFNKARG